MINITEKEKCCGCTACASVCIHNAITMEADVLGFLYPKIDILKCIDCGICEKVCAFNDDYDRTLNLSKPDVYGARHKDISEVKTSRSGAAFIAISDYILEQGGIVYGVGYGEHFRVVHKRAITKHECKEFKGSKYVQSDLTGVFCQVKQDLKKGYKVLFSGTPCQTAGLNNYIGKKLRENLYLVDIVCHGVPAPYIWRDLVTYIESKQGSTIIAVNFRDKQKFGWASHKETFKFENGAFEEGGNVFTKLFHKHIMFRQSCGDCHFCNTVRPSDMTIADFWGWQKTNSEINIDNNGVSLLLVNTLKGREIYALIQDRMFTFSAKLEDVLQPNLQHPTNIHPKRMEFEKDYISKGFVYVINKDYDKLCVFEVIWRIAKSIVKKIIRK